MENSSAIIILFIFIVGISILGAIPGMKHKMNSESWAVGDRNFGRWLNWFIMAGEEGRRYYLFFIIASVSSRGGPAFSFF